ncbi:ABC transporter permease [Streptomyces sp. NPDC050560]|uniref:ABC transporter permease n=1 Tax=Streptomyces sp. NPDC050560 TaxID=3365630 RepID=UPI0037B2E6DA
MRKPAGAPAARPGGGGGTPRRARTRRRGSAAGPLTGVATIVVVLVVWEISSRTGAVDPAFASRPTKVAPAVWDYVTSSQFATDGKHSGTAFLFGLLLSVAVGVVLGILMGWFRWVHRALDYSVSLAYAAPRIALVPILVLWFGIGTQTEVYVIFLMSVFPVLINTISGIRTVAPELIELARAFNARPWQLLWTVLLPSSLPSILAGVRIAIGTSLIGMVVAEFLASTSGVGYMINSAASNFQPDQVFAGVVIVTVVGLLLSELLKWVESRAERWRPANH